MAKIFINYRRGDEPGWTQALFLRLEQTFTVENVFLDVERMPAGEDFVEVLNSQVAACDVLLAVIGKNWLTVSDEAGRRRLDNSADFVRIEIEAALAQGKYVIPVLVGATPMPQPEDLPDSLKPLARRHALRLTHERFKADCDGLRKAIQKALEKIEVPRLTALQQEDEQRSNGQAFDLREMEHAYWLDIKNSNDRELLEDFLRKFPEGVYAPLATRRAATLQVGAVRQADTSHSNAEGDRRYLTAAQEADVELFFRERVGREEGSSVMALSLYDDYCAWCAVQGKQPLGLPVFNRNIGNLGIQKAKIAGRIRWLGIYMLFGGEQPQSDVESFFRERVGREEGSSVMALSLYDDYCSWCEVRGKQQPLGLPVFNRNFSDLGIQKARIARRVRWLGIYMLFGDEE